MLLVPSHIHALEIDARLPTSYGELIVVRNDGGIRDATNYFGSGTVCRAHPSAHVAGRQAHRRDHANGRVVMGKYRGQKPVAALVARRGEPIRRVRTPPEFGEGKPDARAAFGFVAVFAEERRPPIS